MDKLLHLGEGKQIKRLAAVARQVSSIEEDYLAMDDDELRGQTDDFRQRLDNGASLDDLLPEAFATVREASRRVLGKRHFDVQLMGGAALHNGSIAEMKTGEGKTLVAVLPSYLNGLTGQGVHVVTVNDYLAQFQSEQMGRVHHFLGLKTGVILTHKSPAERREAYAAHVTYGTNNEFGFDFLRDNMALTLDDCVQHGHHFAIVDEVDSILVDEARTPLIISGPTEDNAQWYPEFARIARALTREVDYEVDEKKRTVSILESGIALVEDRLGIENLYESVNTPLISYLNNSIKAKELFRRDKDYVVADGEVLIVDEFTGRTLIGRRYNEGLHQALEAKESVPIKAEFQTLATITLQNYFRMYQKLSGMTGTAKTEESEFQKIYGLRVLPIPTNQPMIRDDRRDLVYRTEDAKFAAVVEDVGQRHQVGQPVLIGTASVEKSEELSRRLKRAGVPHQVLNAKQHAREAAIVALAGRKGAVTVATNMAGRGTDIILGGNSEFLADAVLRERGLDPVNDPDEYQDQWPEVVEQIEAQVAAEHDEVVEVGGLYVVGSERHESRRIDNQLRGRSGRQGDPGESRFYLSLGDHLMRLFKGDMVDWLMRTLKVPDDVPIEDKRITRMIQNAQEQVESQNFEVRKNVLRYDDVMNRQRFVVYGDRRKVLEGADVSQQLRDTVAKVVTSYVEGGTEGFVEDWELDQLWGTMWTLYPVQLDLEDYEDRHLEREELVSDFVEDARAAYDKRQEELGEELMRKVERQVLLTVLDRKWREHLYEMDYLREGIGLRSMASRDPLVEYQREGAAMFANMMDSVMEEVVGYLFRLQVKVTPNDAQPAPAVAPPTAKGRKARAKKGSAPAAAAQAVTTASTASAGSTTSAPKLSPLAAEAAAARSELKLTAAGLPAPPASAPLAPVAQPAAKTDPAVLRTNRPGSAGRRNQGKKKRR
ncbi:MAG: preprotein translocase subunit SecA [Propionibacteriaceae bacterium]|nr:preprotein translocase subunit SecA [Propionibacteriaceae bacterium]